MAISKVFWGVLLITALIRLGEANLTEKQIKATGKLVRNNCQPKNKVTDEQIDAMHEGVWTDTSDNVKCYMLCTLVSAKVMKKNGQIDLKTAYAQISQLPEPRVVPTKTSLDKCKDEVEFADDKCDNAWRLARCLYQDNPPTIERLFATNRPMARSGEGLQGNRMVTMATTLPIQHAYRTKRR